MSKDKLKSGSMEGYIMILIERCQNKLNDPNISKESFQYYSGAKDHLYMVLTGHNNPQSNPQ